MKIIPFDPKHLEEMEINGQSSDVIKIFKSKAANFKYYGPCYTGIYKGKIVACAGFIEMWPGVATAWAVLVQSIPRFAVHRAVKKGLATLIESCNYYRVQASVPVDHKAGIRWLEGLGFKQEAVMVKYGPNQEDFVQYVRLG